ncbi:MAG: sugar ABC transporter substrate-binding protein, partial [Lachnospiraceae bacterium]|nr:sugar ABC transporter substrate-binding protein [Lachnospiraceae bacterium]
MKRNTLKKLLAMALASAMACGILAGCGSSSAPAAESSAPAAEAEAEAEAPAAEAEAAEAEAAEAPEAVEIEEGAGIESWVPFENTVELEIPVYNRDNPDWATPHDNYWTNYVQENFGDKYNINVTYVPIPRGAVLENYALLAADQDLPTILMEYDFPKQAQWVEDGYLQTYDLNEFAKVAPTYYQRMVDLGQLGYTQLNGETYFALAERPYYDTNYSYVTFYRKDWTKQVGYEEYPQTWEEQKDMYTKLKEAGICEYPLGGAMLNGVGSDQNYGYRTYPQDELEWATTGDYAIHALSSDANRKFL